MNTKTSTILCVVLWMAIAAGSWPTVTRADDAPEPTQDPSDFQPGDDIVTRQPTSLRAGTETLASIASGTHLGIGIVKPPWLAVTLQRDGKAVAGWISISAVPHVITNSIGMKLVLIPAGEFSMGSGEAAEDVAQAFKGQEGQSPGNFEDEHPQHRVRITRPFHLGVHEITVGQLRQFARCRCLLLGPGRRHGSQKLPAS
jgi:formylglycine-generating enzyme required for sulfatase activity